MMETSAPFGGLALTPVGPFGLGERTLFMVERPGAPALDVLLEQFTSWVLVPAHSATRQSRVSDVIRRIRALTGWSMRDLAGIIGTSHTTVRMFEVSGQITARSRMAASELRPYSAS